MLLGGSPLKLFRLSASGGRVLDSALAGSLVHPSQQQAALLDRLVDAGAVHPAPPPGSGPWSVGDVTVVVPVRGPQSRLDKLIGRIQETTPGVRQVIVVDDGSDVPLTVEHLGVTEGDPPVVLLRRSESGGPGVARNDGMALVETDVVAFVDVDCSPTPGWLEPLLDHFVDPRVAVVAPRIVATVSSPVGDERSDGSVAGAPAIGVASAPVSSQVDGPTRGVSRSVADGRVRSTAGRESWVKRLLFAYEQKHSPLDLCAEPARVAPGTRVSYVPSAALVARVEVLRAVGSFDSAMRVGEDVDLIWRLVAAGERVRYVPSAEVGHDVRPDFLSWLRQRFTYGTSAAPLATRHPGAVAPVAVSPWSMGVWALAVAGLTGPAMGVALATTAQLRRKLPDIEPTEILRLGMGGHLGAGRQLVRAVVRVWWPAAAVGSLLSRRARGISGVAIVSTIATCGERTPQGVALALLDDLSYGAGVWRGCVRERSLRALLPSINGRESEFSKADKGSSELRSDQK
ncbi:MAG: glycosyltransferase [Microthrixaceae bacterium]